MNNILNLTKVKLLDKPILNRINNIKITELKIILEKNHKINISKFSNCHSSGDHIIYKSLYDSDLDTDYTYFYIKYMFPLY